MAPQLPNSKRKRGGPRPSPAAVATDVRASRRVAQKLTASERDPVPEGTINGGDADRDANPRPSKRGRTRKIHDSAAEGPAPAAEDSRIEQNPKRRAHDRRGRDEEGEIDGDGEEPGSLRRSTRERRSADAQPWWVSGMSDTSPAGKQPEAEATTAEPKNRGRPPLQRAGPESLESPTNERPQRKRGPRISKTAEESPAEPEVEPKRKGGKRISGVGETSGHASQAKPPERQRHSVATEAVGRNRGSGAKRRRTSKPDGPPDAGPVEEDDDMENSQVAPPAKYRHLASRTRQVPRSTISAKWMPLDEASMSAVAAFASNMQRPVLVRLQGREQRHQQAHNALRAFTSLMNRKLRKGIPFPPPSTKAVPARNAKSHAIETSMSHVEEFDFEQTINSIQSQEAILNPLLHSILLLKSEKDREEGALERDYETLRTLEANARAEARGWKERGKRAHALVPEAGGVGEAPKETSEVKLEVLTSGDRPAAGIFKGIEDEGTKSLSRRLGSHVESMRGNLQPVADVLPALTKSRAALQAVLHNHLGAQQYDKVFVD